MAIDAKHEDLQSLRIDRSQRGDSGGEPPAWARRYILIGIAVVVGVALSYILQRKGNAGGLAGGVVCALVAVVVEG